MVCGGRRVLRKTAASSLTHPHPHAAVVFDLSDDHDTFGPKLQRIKQVLLVALVTLVLTPGAVLRPFLLAQIHNGLDTTGASPGTFR